MSWGRWLGAAAALAAALGHVGACADVLGIEDASLDPLLVGEPGTDALCRQYCQTVLDNCTDELAVYADLDTCLGVCAVLPAGQKGDEAGNSIHCRLQNAQLAVAEPALHCPRAGPGGNAVCGDNCEAYCLLFEAACRPSFDATFNGQLHCLTNCRENVPDLGAYDTSIQSGDSVQCRLYHVSVATLSASEHCGHAAGLPPCVEAAGGAGGTDGAGGAGSGGAGGG